MKEKKTASASYQKAEKSRNLEKKEINVTALVGKKDLFCFLLYHNYARFIGELDFYSVQHVL